jgi:hypothetical protein
MRVGLEAAGRQRQRWLRCSLPALGAPGCAQCAACLRQHTRTAPHATHAQDPAGPPPPYASVVMGDAAAAGAADGPRDFEIVVADPVKQGEGVSAFVSYKVRSHTNLQQYARPSSEVIRRFRDFVWLHDKLVEENRWAVPD